MAASTQSVLPPGYILHTGYPSLDDYLELRRSSGLTPKTRSQAERIASGSWYGCYITHESDNTAVAMGRIIGDGGWYFHVADMAVHPSHQRKGLGDQVMKRLLQEIADKTPEDGEPYVTLFADPPGVRLYKKNGFVEVGEELGMVLPVDRVPPRS
jgi:GNAT superfamily N-acetyltransferase